MKNSKLKICCLSALIFLGGCESSKQEKEPKEAKTEYKNFKSDEIKSHQAVVNTGYRIYK